jgi:hypothetical protein
MRRGRPPTTGAKLDLPEDLAADLRDFCEAHYDASQKRIVQSALRDFIQAALAAEPELRKRFDEARGKRLARTGQNVTVLRTGK